MSVIKQKAISGVKWNAASTIILMLVQILRLSILTRILDKSDFGLIAIATMVIGFTDIFSELGLTVAVIHKQDISDKQYSSVYWTNIILSILIFFVLWGISPFISKFYDQPILTTVIPLLGIQVLLNGFGKMFQTIKSKNLEYAFISKVRISACIVGFCVTVMLALIGWGVYSLVVGQLTQAAVMQIIYAIEGRKSQKILWYLNVKEISDFIKIGSYRLGSQILDFISSRMDVFLIGKFFGMDDLGIYNLAKDLIGRPYGIINLLTSNVASSTFAKLQSDLEVVRQSYIKILNIVSTLAIPIYVICFLSADAIVYILYGSNFLEVAILLRILSFYGIECSISSQGAILQVSLGRTDIGFKWTFMRILCTIGVIFTTSKLNIQAVAYGQLLLSIISLFLFWFIAIKPIIRISFSSYLETFLMPLLVSFICAVPLLIIFSLFFYLWWQFLSITIFIIIYIIYMWTFQKEQVQRVLRLVQNK